MNIDRLSRLQLVQSPDLKNVYLPPSVPMSADGEEGAFAYNRRLQESNIIAANSRSECQQIPPNRTIISSKLENTVKNDSLTLHSQSKVTSTFLSSTVRARSLTPVRYPIRIKTSSHSIRKQEKEYVRCSSALPSSRCSLPVEKKSRPLIPIPDKPIGITVTEQTDRYQSERSRNIDNIFQRFLHFTRRLKAKKSKSQTSTLSNLSFVQHEEELDSNLKDTAKASYTPSASSYWELPPNYVQMIFTKNPRVKEETGDRVFENLSVNSPSPSSSKHN